MGLLVPLTKNTNARRPDLILELKIDKKTWICDMACPQQNNNGAMRAEKTVKYRQIAFKTREQCPSHKVYVVLVVVGLTFERFIFKRFLKIMNCWMKLLLLCKGQY